MYSAHLQNAVLAPRLPIVLIVFKNVIGELVGFLSNERPNKT